MSFRYNDVRCFENNPNVSDISATSKFMNKIIITTMNTIIKTGTIHLFL